MAAVAGSKGRIHADAPFRPSFQASIAQAVLDGRLRPAEAAERIVARAKLREVGVDTNMACNLRCKYCYLDDRPVAPGKLTPDEWMAKLSPLAREGCKLFAFIGKEPLLDETAITVIERLDALRREEGLRFRTGMVTNGTHLDRHVDRLRGSRIDYLDISLDGLPEVNDAWRGEGVSRAVLANVERYLQTAPAHDFFIACVLHQGNLRHVPAFAEALFDRGVPGFFCSPVLKFTRNERIADWAISVEELEETIDRLGDVASRYRQHQVIVDLPYKYAWQLLAGRVRAEEILEDAMENPVHQPVPGIPLFLKMNLLSFSYWRAIRITHDGTVVADMDMAAHPQYASAGSGGKMAPPYWASHESRAFHCSFVRQHSRRSNLFDREVADRLECQPA